MGNNRNVYTQDTVALLLAADDEGFGSPSLLQEMIRRALHTGATFTTDNTAVWDVVCHIMHEGPGWGWVHAFAHCHGRRSAYLALKTHYLGDVFQVQL